MRRLTLPVVIAVAAATLCGCQLTPSFTLGYEVTPTRLRPTPIATTLAVADFEDARGERRYSTTGKMFLTYIPLIPYVPLNFERLEESIQKTSDRIAEKGAGMTRVAKQGIAPPLSEAAYPVSFAKAISEDLAATGLFERVVYGDQQSGRYTLRGTLHATPLRNSTTSYMLGMPGVLLWLFPIPMGRMSSGVQATLELHDRQTNAVVWTYEIDEQISKFYSVYTSSAMIYGRAGAFSLNILLPPKGSGVDRRSLYGWHFAALRQGMAKAREDLAQHFQKSSARH
ncbi:MAG: hypothetical protein AAF581_12020 [Planctomycetota bacterium]